MASEEETNDVQNEEANVEDAQNEQEVEQENTQENCVLDEEVTKNKNLMASNHVDRSNFIHGLAVGLGIGCIATFVIVWLSVFFTPRIPSGITYENLLSIFVYPLIYLLAVGLVALTAGIVREYFAVKNKL
jgi:hypothetical protein